MRKVLRKLRNHGITLPQGILLSEEDLDRIEEDLASIKIAEDRAKELHDEGHAEIIATYLAGIEGIIDYATLCSDFETWCQVFAIRLPEGLCLSVPEFQEIQEIMRSERSYEDKQELVRAILNSASHNEQE